MRLLETICFAAGAALLMFYFGARAFAEVERGEAVAAFTQARASAPAPAIDAPALWSSVDQSAWSDARRQHYATLLADAQAPPATPVAVLRIRRLRLEVPVYAELTERNLNRGAALISGTAPPGSNGNVAIAAHRDGFFRLLKDIAVGDVVEVDSLARHQSYRVAALSVVDPADTSSLRDTGEPVVTLVTCYPFYFVGSAPQRFIVRAVAIH